MKKIIQTILLASLLFIFLTPYIVAADTLQEKINHNNATIEVEVIGEDVYQNSPTAMVAEIIKIALSLLGILFVTIMIYSGYQWMMAGGNSETISTAKQRIMNAVIGLIIVLAAFAITEFVLDKVIMAVE